MGAQFDGYGEMAMLPLDAERLCVEGVKRGLTWFPNHVDQHGNARNRIFKVYPEARTAILVCRQCSSRKACLAMARANGETRGVWGGEYLEGGVQFRRWLIETGVSPGVAEVEGTECDVSSWGTIKAHRKAGETLCDRCRVFQRNYLAEWKLANAEG